MNAPAAAETELAKAASSEELDDTARATGAALAEGAEPQLEEVWRPRRHQRGERRKDGATRARKRPQDKAARSQTNDSAEAAVSDGKERQKSAGFHKDRREGWRNSAKNRPDRSRDGRHRRPKGGERRTPEVISAAPPRKAGTDPDSPFAALGELRDALDKRGKESST
jgi:ATP-dependent RNA helicase SUPV3L1/SUV3